MCLFIIGVFLFILDAALSDALSNHGAHLRSWYVGSSSNVLPNLCSREIATLRGSGETGSVIIAGVAECKLNVTCTCLQPRAFDTEITGTVSRNRIVRPPAVRKEGAQCDYAS